MLTPARPLARSLTQEYMGNEGPYEEYTYYSAFLVFTPAWFSARLTMESLGWSPYAANYLQYLERLMKGGEFDTDSLCGDEYHKMVFARSTLGFVDGFLEHEAQWPRPRLDGGRLRVVRAAIQRRLIEHCVHFATAALEARSARSAKGKKKA